MSRSKETYHWYKQHGICVMCHRSNAVESLTTCAECREKIKIKNRKYSRKYFDEHREELNQKKELHMRSAVLPGSAWSVGRILQKKVV